MHYLLGYLQIGLAVSRAAMMKVQRASSCRRFGALPVVEGEAPDVAAPIAFSVDHLTNRVEATAATAHEMMAAEDASLVQGGERRIKPIAVRNVGPRLLPFGLFGEDVGE